MTFSFCLSKSPKTELHLYFDMSNFVIFFLLFNALSTELIKKTKTCNLLLLPSEGSECLKSFELHLILREAFRKKLQNL